MSAVKGKIRKVSDFVELKKLNQEISKNPGGYVRDSAAKFELDSGKLDGLENLWPKGRIFNDQKELRRVGNEFWLLEETKDGVYEIDDKFKFLTIRDQMVRAVKYLKGGKVQFIRFKKVIKK